MELEYNRVVTEEWKCDPTAVHLSPNLRAWPYVRTSAMSSNETNAPNLSVCHVVCVDHSAIRSALTNVNLVPFGLDLHPEHMSVLVRTVYEYLWNHHNIHGFECCILLRISVSKQRKTLLPTFSFD